MTYCYSGESFICFSFCHPPTNFRLPNRWRISVELDVICLQCFYINERLWPSHLNEKIAFQTPNNRRRCFFVIVLVLWAWAWHKHNYEKKTKQNKQTSSKVKIASKTYSKLTKIAISFIPQATRCDVKCGAHLRSFQSSLLFFSVITHIRHYLFISKCHRVCECFHFLYSSFSPQASESEMTLFTIKWMVKDLVEDKVDGERRLTRK